MLNMNKLTRCGGLKSADKTEAVTKHQSSVFSPPTSLSPNTPTLHYSNFSSLYFLTTLLLLLSSPSLAATITGTVTGSQTGTPLPNTMVEIERLGRSTYTDSTGHYVLDSVPSGSWNLIFYNQTAEPLNRNDVFVGGDAEERVDVELNPKAYALEKMVVRANAFRKAPDMAASTKTMNFDEVLRAPGALLDVQRAVQDLPSVSSGADNTNEIVVRGGTPGENLLIMDNIEIPNPNHFANEGSGGGVVSLINPLLVKGLIFSAGAPPAQYGGKASSVLDVRLRDGNDKMVLGGVDLGVAGAGFHAEGPLWNGATFMASGTKSFLDLVSDYAKATAVPQYWGVQAKIKQKVDKQKITANVIYGDNTILIGNARKDVGSVGQKVSAGGLVYAAGATLETSWSDRISSSLTLSGVGNTFNRLEYTDRADSTGSQRDLYFINRSSEQEQTAKVQASYNFLDNNKVIAGLSFKRCDFSIDIWEKPDTLTNYIVNSTNDTSALVQTDSYGDPIVYSKDAKSRGVGYKIGAYSSLILYPIEKLRFIPGVRVDKFTYNNSLAVSPRVGFVYSLAPALDLTGAFGIQYQDPDYANLVAAPENRDLRAKRAMTGIIGTEYLYSKFATKLIVEAFYKHYDNIAIDSTQLTVDSLDKSDVLFSIGEGRSYGMELYVQKKLTSNVFWSLSYSLSKSELKDLRPFHGEQWYPGDYDFRNSLTLTGGYKTELINYEWYKKVHKNWWFAVLSPIMPIADRIEFSAKWRYLGGRPYTKPTFNELHQQWVSDQNQLNSSRYDDYHKLDLRFERRFSFGFLQMIYYFDLQNIYNKDNIWTYMYSDKLKDPTAIYQFHFFPAGGVIIGF